MFVVILERVATRSMGPVRAAAEAHSDEAQIRDLLASDRQPPLHPDLPGSRVGVFVSRHTHAPALSRLERGNGDALIANSGC